MEEFIQSKLKTEIDRESIIQLPNNHIPKGLVPLEMLFDLNDMPYKPTKTEKESVVSQHNIGSLAHSKFFKLSTHLSST